MPCTTTATDPATALDITKFHTSLNVSDLPRAIAFYRLLLGCEPAKQRSDYAKFELAEPPLVLSLIPGRPAPGGVLNHFGLRVPDAETLVEMQRRLEAGGVRTKREEGVACCYARQTKFWAVDPDRVLWEIYLVHEDLDERGGGEVPAAEALPEVDPEPAGNHVVWQHRIDEPIPARIPHENNSVHEVVLEGSANLASAATQLAPLLAEAFRVLRPGGEIRLHGLTGDAPLTVPLPSLPGPAAAVETVLSHREAVDALAAAGFIHLHLETLSPSAHFTVGGVGLRELLVNGRKPGHRTEATSHTAIYLGPLAVVTDDLGHTYRRGEPIALNVHDWQALSRSAAASSFLFL
jgi:catechol 2,3-dioxygenase-like lactoylglutathione lyase family enzyme